LGYRTVATASSQSPMTIAAGAATPLPQDNVNRILPYRRHTERQFSAAAIAGAEGSK
jgi:hypothetical protein